MLSPAQLDRHDSQLTNYHLGVVVDNNDPLEHQRVRVAIPSKLEAANVEDLPWITRCKFTAFGEGDNYGTVAVPRIGSRVLVVFQDEDPSHALYTADLTAAGFQPPPELKENYPNRVGMVTPFNDLFFLDQQTGEMVFRRASGTGFSIDKDGNVSLLVAKDFTTVVKGDYTLMVEGNATTIVKGDQATQVQGTDTTQIQGDKKEAISGAFTQSSASRSINGRESHSGPVNVQNDLVASGISVSKHGTSGVKGGSDISGPPVPR